MSGARRRMTAAASAPVRAVGPAAQSPRKERAAAVSILSNTILIVLKVVAGVVTGSIAILTEAAHSAIDLVASVIAFFSVRKASEPADEDHPYGHDKVEFFAAVIVGVLIVVAALSIFRHAWEAWLNPRPIDQPAEGIAINALATVLNAIWSMVLIRVGRHARSIALVSDGQHLLADVVTSVGVAAGVGAAVLTGYLVLDPILAAATGVYVLWSGMAMISSSVGGLMDAAPQPAVVRRIRELVAESAAGALEAHDLRMRHAGKLTFLEFHLVVPGAMTVAESHGICDHIEETLRAEMPHLVITIHVEPEEKAKQHGVPVL